MAHYLYPKRGLAIAQKVGLTSNLNLVLDAGDARSYDGSSQTWTDPVNAYNFFLGTDGSSEIKDPTPSGTAGVPAANSYFNFDDGNEFFKQTAAHTFADGWHKNNGAFSIVCVGYFINGLARSILDTTAGGNDGMSFGITSGERVNLTYSLTNTTAETKTMVNALTTDSWNFVACAYDEATTSVTLQANSIQETFTSTASTATDNHPGVIRLCGSTDTPSTPFNAGERIAWIAAWSTKLTDLQLTRLYRNARYRFPTMP